MGRVISIEIQKNDIRVAKMGTLFYGHHERVLSRRVPLVNDFIISIEEELDWGKHDDEEKVVLRYVVHKVKSAKYLTQSDTFDLKLENHEGQVKTKRLNPSEFQVIEKENHFRNIIGYSYFSPVRGEQLYRIRSKPKLYIKRKSQVLSKTDNCFVYHRGRLQELISFDPVKREALVKIPTKIYYKELGGYIIDLKPDVDEFTAESEAILLSPLLINPCYMCWEGELINRDVYRNGEYNTMILDHYYSECEECGAVRASTPEDRTTIYYYGTDGLVYDSKAENILYNHDMD